MASGLGFYCFLFRNSFEPPFRKLSPRSGLALYTPLLVEGALWGGRFGLGSRSVTIRFLSCLSFLRKKTLADLMQIVG